jgi:hypothetical protein
VAEDGSLWSSDVKVWEVLPPAVAEMVSGEHCDWTATKYDTFISKPLIFAARPQESQNRALSCVSFISWLLNVSDISDCYKYYVFGRRPMTRRRTGGCAEILPRASRNRSRIGAQNQCSGCSRVARSPLAGANTVTSPFQEHYIFDWVLETDRIRVLFVCSSTTFILKPILFPRSRVPNF